MQFEHGDGPRDAQWRLDQVVVRYKLPPGARRDASQTRMAEQVPFEALSRIYPGEYGAEGEIEIRQVFEPEPLDASS
jgi:hypothetical protein